MLLQPDEHARKVGRPYSICFRVRVVYAAVLDSRPDSGYRYESGWASRFGAALDTIRINRLSVQSRASQRYWVKQRNPGSRWVISAANTFFRLVRNPVFVLADAAAWREWEVWCFRRLNGKDPPAFSHGDAVWIPHIPGDDLAFVAKQARLQPVHLTAAGTEFRRMHDTWSPEFNGLWSHGDPHLGNVIFENETGRARIIDFETTHFRRLAAERRHADDLKVFLLDLLGRSSDAEWPENARIFLQGYGRTRIIRCLRRNFVMPSGSERLWWAIRTSYLPGALLRHRIMKLQAVLP